MPHFIFDSVGEVVFTAFFGACVTDLIAKLDFHRQTII